MDGSRFLIFHSSSGLRHSRSRCGSVDLGKNQPIRANHVGSMIRCCFQSALEVGLLQAAPRGEEFQCLPRGVGCSFNCKLAEGEL
jgi:hypothetical protein